MAERGRGREGGREREREGGGARERKQGREGEGERVRARVCDNDVHVWAFQNGLWASQVGLAFL